MGERMMKRLSGMLIGVVLALFLTACTADRATEDEAGLQVVATTTLVGDVVRIVGGEQIRLTVMLRPGAMRMGSIPRPRM